MDIFDAVRLNDIGRVVQLLDNPDLDINQRDDSNNTPLVIAVQEGFIEIVTLLLNRSIAGNICVHSDGDSDNDSDAGDSDDDSDEPSPLHIAAQKGYTSIVALLLAHPTIKTKKGNRLWRGYSALYESIGNNREEIAHLLISHPDVDVNLGDFWDDTPLSLAITDGMASVVKALVFHPKIDVNKPGYGGEAVLIKAIRKSKKEFVELLLAHPEIEVNVEEPRLNNTPIDAAALCDHELLRALLFHPKIDVTFGSALASAASGNQIESMKLLLAYPNIDVGSTPLFFAVQYGHIEAVSLLLSSPNIIIDGNDPQSDNPFFVAVSENHKSILKLFHEHSKIDLTWVNEVGESLLGVALRSNIGTPGNLSQFLLSLPEINSKQQNKNGFLLLHIQVMIKLLDF